MLNKQSIVDAVVVWNGQKLRTKALLDTGASLNVMTAGIWRAFDSPPLYPNPSRVLNADRSIISAAGVTPLDGCADHRVAVAYLVIETRGRDQLIWGREFIIQHKVKLNLLQRHAKLAIPAAEAPMASDEEILSVEQQLEKKGLAPEIYEEQRQGVWLNLRTELKEVVSDVRENGDQVAVVEWELPVSVMDVVMGEMNTEGYKIPPLEHLEFVGNRRAREVAESALVPPRSIPEEQE